MATYTANGGIKLIATGDESGTWGTSTNSNFEILDKLTNGYKSVDLGTSLSYNLDDSDGTVDSSGGQSKVIKFTGTPASAVDVYITSEDAEKLYFIQNSCGQTINVWQDSAKGLNSAVIEDTLAAIVYADGANPGNAYNFTDLMKPNLTNAGVTATAAELNYNDITALGQSEASKVVTADSLGDVEFTEEVKAKSYVETHLEITGAASSITLDCSVANVFTRTLTANTSITFSNAPVSSAEAYGMTVEIIQDSGGSGYTVTWPSSVKWPNGAEPALSTTANYKDIFVLYTRDTGTTWYGFLAGRNMS